MNWVWEMIKWMTTMFKIHYASLQWNRNSVDRPRPMGLLFSISISTNTYSNLKTWWSLTHRVPTLICVGKHNICVGNCEIILIGNREIKRPRICHNFKTANFNSREFKWGYSMWFYAAKSGFMWFKVCTT